MNRYVAAALLFVSSLSLAGTNGGYGGAFTRVGAAVRAQGMGNAFTAVAQGPSALYFNPGALSFQTVSEFNASSRSMALDRRVDFLAFSTPLHPRAAEGKVVNAGVAVGWLHAGVSDIDSRDFDGRPLEEIKMSSNVFQFGFGVQFSEKVGAGLAAKVVYETFGKIADDNSSVNGDGFGADFGVYAKPIDHLTLGAQLKDLNTKTTWNTSNYWSQGQATSDEWPMQMRFGAAYEQSGLLGAFDIESSKMGETRIHVGAEGRTQITDQQWIAGRLGLDHDALNFGVGLGFEFWKVLSKVDLVYALESVAPDNSVAVSWGVEF
ncbi:MAG: hypothetical protein H6508_01110 [Calditrichaeota bacterium]|nr:hypothetical protein [Calditrichota bacterium]